MTSQSNSFPTAPQAALLLLAGFLLQYVLGIALYDFRRVLGLSNEQLGTLTTLLANGILIALVLHHIGIGYRELMHPGKTSPVATFVLLLPPILLLIPLLMLLDMVLIEALETVFPKSRWEEAAFESMLSPTLPAVIAVCVVAPFVEEMLFRGILLRAFLARYPRRLAIGYSALYFGAAHLNIYQFILAFGLGTFLGWLYERSRSLIPCIALHAAVNTSVMAMSTQKSLALSGDLAAVSLLTWLAALAAGATGAWILRRLLAYRRRESSETS